MSNGTAGGIALNSGRKLTVRKLAADGREIASYQGREIDRGVCSITLEARWNRARLDLGFIVFEPGDLFIETFFSDRWYNIFEIREGGGHLKGWYCNITRPARISRNEVAAEDLALDLWIAPDGTTHTLDIEEFERLPLSGEEKEMALRGEQELRRRVERGDPPFLFFRNLKK